jgi:zinc/manganese transport system substrate-binding protein
MRRLIEIVQAEQIKALLQEPGVETKAFETLAEDLKIKVSLFNPIAMGEATSSEPTVYLRRMEENVTNLVEALSD